MSKPLTIFVMQGCPYCRNAKKAAQELAAENEAFAGLNLTWVDENEEAALAEQYDYYYVPSVFDGTDKLYECSPSEDYASIKEHLRQCFEAAC